MFKTIRLTQGKAAIVDESDFEWLNQWKWFYHNGGYAARSIWENGKNRLLLMHRIILNPPPRMQGDHRNGNRLDNRRCNLRICTRSQQAMNSKKRSGCSSCYKGVMWAADWQKWKAKIKLDGKQRFLGHFDSEQRAARAYNVAARELFGEFARLNIIEEE